MGWQKKTLETGELPTLQTLYLALTAEVTRCTTVLQGAQRTYDNTLAINNRNSSKTYVKGPKFDPIVNYSSQLELFPFFECVNDVYLTYFGDRTLIGRVTIVETINSIVRDRKKDKYQPIIISTSRGMGKTFLIKCVGSQVT